MKKEIIISRESDDLRVAITEDGHLAELFVENANQEHTVGSIYLGKVARVVPGMNAAFIDIGMKQDAFLHFSDIGSTVDSVKDMLGEEDADVDTDDDDSDEDDFIPESPFDSPAAAVAPAPARTEQRQQERPQQNGDRRRDHRGQSTRGANLQRGEPIIVQVTREAFANKGVRVTTEISLPGRFVVLMPFENSIGVSKKIHNIREKRRLRRIVKSIIPKGFGVIVRTVAENKEDDVLRSDLQVLVDRWHDIERSARASEGGTAMLYREKSVASTVMRDLFTRDVTRVVVDSKELYEEIHDYVAWAAPSLADTVELHKGRESVYEYLGLQKEVDETTARKVYIKTGGYIIIEHTEAMVVIDVNSGRYAAQKEQELNSLRTNMEAAREIGRQIRLRDIGGIIVIDFIDMLDDRNRKKIFDEMKKELRRDRARSTVLPLTDFCIMQITRQRVRRSLAQNVSEVCPMCSGTGSVQGRATIVSTIERWVEHFRNTTGERKVILTAHPVICGYLEEGTLSPIRRLRWKHFMNIKLVDDPALHGDDFHVFSIKQQRDVTEEFMAMK